MSNFDGRIAHYLVGYEKKVNSKDKDVGGLFLDPWLDDFLQKVWEENSPTTREDDLLIQGNYFKLGSNFSQVKYDQSNISFEKKEKMEETEKKGIGIILNGISGSGKTTLLKMFREQILEQKTEKDDWVFISEMDFIHSILFETFALPIYKKSYKNRKKYKGKELRTLINKDSYNKSKKKDGLALSQFFRENRKVGEQLLMKSSKQLLEQIKGMCNSGKNVILEKCFLYDDEFKLWMDELKDTPVFLIKVFCSIKTAKGRMKRIKGCNSIQISSRFLLKQKRIVHGYNYKSKKCYDLAFCTELSKKKMRGLFFTQIQELRKNIGNLKMNSVFVNYLRINHSSEIRRGNFETPQKAKNFERTSFSFVKRIQSILSFHSFVDYVSYVHKAQFEESDINIEVEFDEKLHKEYHSFQTSHTSGLISQILGKSMHIGDLKVLFKLEFSDPMYKILVFKCLQVLNRYFHNYENETNCFKAIDTLCQKIAKRRTKKDKYPFEIKDLMKTIPDKVKKKKKRKSKSDKSKLKDSES